MNYRTAPVCDTLATDLGARAWVCRPLSEAQLICTVARGTLVSHHKTGEHLLSKEDLIPAEGVIVDKQPNAFFQVRLDNSDHIVLAQISGKMRKNRIRILMGDRVSVEMSPYDLKRGRITYRFK